jgi:hypothetical protein
MYGRLLGLLLERIFTASVTCRAGSPIMQLYDLARPIHCESNRDFQNLPSANHHCYDANLASPRAITLLGIVRRLAPAQHRLGQ